MDFKNKIKGSMFKLTMDFNQQHVDPNCGNNTNSVSASMDVLLLVSWHEITTSDSKQQKFAG